MAEEKKQITDPVMEKLRRVPIKKAGDWLQELKTELVNRSAEPPFPLHSLPRLSQKTWGLRPGLVVFAGRTSQGKSDFLQQVALDYAGQGVPVLYLSLEMTVISLLERMFCNMMFVNNEDLLKGRVKNYRMQWNDFTQVMQKLPLVITDGIGATFGEVNKLVQLIRGQQPRVVILDYVQNVAHSGFEGREILNEYIRYFRELALRNSFIGIMASQINRSAMTTRGGNRPELHHLKETGCLEEAADMVMLGHWDWFYTKEKGEFNNYEINVAKNRMGRTFLHRCYYYPQICRFSNSVITFNEEEKDLVDGARKAGLVK